MLTLQAGLMSLKAALCPSAVQRLAAHGTEGAHSQRGSWNLLRRQSSLGRRLLLPLRMAHTALVRARRQVANAAIVQQMLHMARVLRHLMAFLRERAARARGAARDSSASGAALVDPSAMALHNAQLRQLRFHIRHGTLETALGVLERALVLSDLFMQGIDVEVAHDVQGDWRIVARRRGGSAGARQLAAGLDERTPWLLLQDLLITRCALRAQCQGTLATSTRTW